MKETIEKLFEISEYLGDQDYSVQIHRMKESLDTSEYMLSVMGQFSAGKSRLINNLLERDILPVHITETTAVITIIKYGSNECAELIFNDGGVQTIGVDDVKDLWQGESEKLNGVENIIVYLDNPLLKSGLVIADTPGINTIIEKHIELTEYILRRTDRIVFVLGKPMTSYDADFAGRIINAGLSMMFVRTHMDELAECEENFEEAIGREIEQLYKFTDDEVFFLSNDCESSFFNVVSDLRSYLSETLGANIRDNIVDNCRKMSAFIAENYISRLDERVASLRAMSAGNNCEYEQKKAALTAELDRLNVTLERNRRRMEQNYSKTDEQARRDLMELKEAAKCRLRAAISEFDEDVLNSGNASICIAELVRRENERLFENYISQFDSMLKENSGDLREECMSNTMTDFCITECIPESFSQVDDMAGEIGAKLCVLEQAQNDAAQEMEKLSTSLALREDDSNVLREQLRQAQEEYRAAKEMLDAYPDYQPQYIITDPGSDAGEKTMRMVGNIADWATILIPGAGWAKGIQKGTGVVAKVLRKVPKLAKLANTVQKAGKVIAKNKKVIQTIDIVGDAARVGKKLKGEDMTRAEEMRKSGKATVQDVLNQSVRTEHENKPNMLDYLSLEYHFGNIGRIFDRPPVYEVDKEYERTYHEERRKIKEQMSRALEKQLSLSSSQASKTRQREQQVEQLRLRQIYQQREKEQLLRLEADMQKEKARKIHERMMSDYSSQAANAVDEVCGHILKETSDQIHRKVTGYIEVCDFGIHSAINGKISELDALYSEYNGADKERLDEEISRCEGYRAALDSMEKNC